MYRNIFLNHPKSWLSHHFVNCTIAEAPQCGPALDCRCAGYAQGRPVASAVWLSGPGACGFGGLERKRDQCFPMRESASTHPASCALEHQSSVALLLLPLPESFLVVRECHSNSTVAASLGAVCFRGEEVVREQSSQSKNTSLRRPSRPDGHGLIFKHHQTPVFSWKTSCTTPTTLGPIDSIWGACFGAAAHLPYSAPAPVWLMAPGMRAA